MKKNPKSIAEQFDQFIRQSSKLDWTTYPYDPDSRKDRSQQQEIATALMVWKFLRKLLQNNPGLTVAAKRQWIADFILNHPLAQEYELVTTVAQIEALPDTIWRKLLWRENLDFSSYEACLRRLNPEQCQAIADNYEDLFAGIPETPRVLKKSWRDRVKLFFGLTTNHKLLTEDYQDRSRNMSKGAYAFSLLGLDFGFSLYPGGEHNDKKITNQKYTRFFSVKEHIDDFVVNKEDGKYWWLYKTARSNWAFYPHKKVEMKKHVCPGFWMTLIIHTLFWLVSPIALFSSAVFALNYGFGVATWITAAFASPMIIWAIVALLRTAGYYLWKLIWGYMKDNKALKITGIIVLVLIALAIIITVATAVIWFLGYMIGALTTAIGPLLSVMTVLTAAFYLVFLVTCVRENDPLFEYSDIPAFVRFLLHLSVGATTVVLLDKFVVMPVVEFIVRIATIFWDWYTSDLWLSNWIIFSIPFFTLFVYFYDLFLRDEKRFVSLRRTFTWLTRGFMTISIVVMAVLLLKHGTVDFLFFGLAAPGLILSAMFLVVGLSFVMLDQVNQNNIDERLMASKFLSKMDEKIGGLTYKVYVTKIMESKWLPADTMEKWLVIERIQYLAFFFFDEDPQKRVRFLDLMIQKGSLKNLDLLNVYRHDIIIKIGSRKRLDLVQLLMEGNSVATSLEIIESRLSMMEKRMNKAMAIVRMVAAPFIKIAQAVVWLWEKIGQFLGTLKDLWDFFNKRCPYVTQSKYLD